MSCKEVYKNVVFDLDIGDNFLFKLKEKTTFSYQRENVGNVRPFLRK
jgi:hypothetical protein